MLQQAIVETFMRLSRLSKYWYWTIFLRVLDNEGMLPVHVACERYQPDPIIVKYLVDLNIRSLCATNNRGGLIHLFIVRVLLRIMMWLNCFWLSIPQHQ